MADDVLFGNTFFKVKEPAWHRNQRKRRQQDRGLLHAHKLGFVPHCASTVAAAHRLTLHHGSAAVTMPECARPGNDWLCKRCKDSSGAAFTNWASRKHCLKCKVHKGQCFGGDVTNPKASPTKPLAQKQVEQGKKLEKQATQHHQQQLRKENERLKQEVDRLKGTANDKEQPDKPEEKSKLKELERCRALYAKLPGEDQKVKELDQQIQELRGAKAATHPAGEQLRRVEQLLAKKKKKRQATEEEVASLQKQLAVRQEELATIAGEEKLAEEELEKVKHTITNNVNKGPSHWFGMAEGCSEWLKVLPRDLLQQQGLDDSSLAAFNVLCQKFAACSEAARAARAAEEEATKQQAAASTTAVTVGEEDATMRSVDAAHTVNDGSNDGEPGAKAARTEREGLEALCSSTSPEEAAAGLKCKELLAARAAKRGTPY